MATLEEMLQGLGNTDQGDAVAKQVVTRGDVPLDGTIYATSQYLEMIQGNRDPEFYRRYLNHLSYATGLYRFEGSPEIVKLSPSTSASLPIIEPF